MDSFLSVSAVARDSAESFMKFTLVSTMAFEKVYSHTFLRRVSLWHSQAKGFTKRFSLPTADMDKLHGFLLKGANAKTLQKEKNKNIYANRLTSFLEMLYEHRDSFKRELDLSREDLSFLNDMRLYFVRKSDAAASRIMKRVSMFNDPQLNALFVHEDSEDMSSELNRLKALVKKHSGSTGTVMPTEILERWQAHNKAKGTKLKDHETYLELKRVLRNSYKKRLLTLIRSSGEPYLPLRDVIKILNEEGVVHALPSGFIGLIDDHGRFYTTAGKQLLQAPVGEVLMNPEYNPKLDNTYVCKYLPPFAQDYSTAYTVDFRKAKKRKKFDVVSATIPLIPKLSKKWRSKMGTETKENILADILEFVYQTSSRISSKNARTAGERTFGATQLMKKHLSFGKTGVTISYKGKSAGDQKHKIKANTVIGKNLISIMGQLVEDRSASMHVFSRDGKTTYTSAVLNSFMRELGFPEGFTIHKLRTIRGSILAIDALEKLKIPKDVKESTLNKMVEQALLIVGKELGHMNGGSYTATTAIQNYINPEILQAFYAKFEDQGIRPSEKIQKAIRSID